MKNKKAEIFDYIKAILIALVIAFFVTHFIIINTVVPSDSMQNTIHVGDRLVTNRLAYTFCSPKRGDIIVFPYPDDESILYVKRIIGLPGEKVDIIDGEVYIDGEKLQEDYVSSEITDSTKNSSYEVPENCVFVMGDNRGVSLDARYWKNKYVNIDDILGKVCFRYYPTISIIK